jgi:hypothetical protein
MNRLSILLLVKEGRRYGGRMSNREGIYGTFVKEL